jgi:nucleoside-diphosphate-sugar epimerase
LKILITGSTGFLGNILSKHLSDIHEVYGLSRSPLSEYTCNLISSIPFFENSFELIIHTAGLAHKFSEDYEMFNSNCIGTNNLLLGLEKIQLPKEFVFISSVSVYGVTEGVFINENTPLLAKDAYGISKIKAEQIVTNWCQKNNVKCTILRLPLIAGPNPPGNLGTMISGIKNGYYFNIDGGKVRKSIVLAKDIAKYITTISKIGGTYNLTDRCNPTINELSKTIAKQLGKTYLPNLPLFIAIILAKFGDLMRKNSFPINSYKLNKITSTLTFDDSKAKSLFGWNPTSVIEEFKIIE